MKRTDGLFIVILLPVTDIMEVAVYLSNFYAAIWYLVPYRRRAGSRHYYEKTTLLNDKNIGSVQRLVG